MHQCSREMHWQIFSLFLVGFGAPFTFFHCSPTPVTGFEITLSWQHLWTCCKVQLAKLSLQCCWDPALFCWYCLVCAVSQVLRSKQMEKLLDLSGFTCNFCQQSGESMGRGYPTRTQFWWWFQRFLLI